MDLRLNLIAVVLPLSHRFDFGWISPFEPNNPLYNDYTLLATYVFKFLRIKQENLNSLEVGLMGWGLKIPW